MLRLERPDVGNHLLGQVLLVTALLDVRAAQALDVALVEDGRHRLDGFHLGPHLIQQRRLQHTCRTRGGVAVFFEDVPSAENDVIEPGQVHEILDTR